jgi:hypothetical protein
MSKNRYDIIFGRQEISFSKHESYIDELIEMHQP